MQLGDKIRKIRDLRGLKQEEIAAKLHITAQAYSKIERNETKIDLERLKQIADALDISVADIEAFSDKNLFINNLNECPNGQGTYFIVNNYQNNEDMLKLYEKLFAEQRLFMQQQQEQMRIIIEQLFHLLNKKD